MNFNQAGCWCCTDCSNHLINKRNLVVPCNNRRTCEKYLKFQEDRKVATIIEKQQSALRNPRNPPNI